MPEPPTVTLAPGRLVVAAPALLLLVLLAVQVDADPAAAVTFSDSPFTDEGWSVLGARNQALLDRWATDGWELFWAQLPFNVANLAVFELFGVGIVQARVVSLACTGGAVLVLGLLLARRLGIGAAVVGATALAASPLVLYYGRLALLEPMVLLFLVAGMASLVGRETRPAIPLGAAAGILLALAVGTKPSAIVPVIGMLAGAALAGGALPDMRRRVAAAAGVIALAGAVWFAVVLPQSGLLEVILRIWPQQRAPTSVGELLGRIGGYLAGSDGAITLAAVLLVAGLGGAAVTAAGWRRLDPGVRLLAGAAAGWFVLGVAFLLVLDYRPNRYAVPVLPALAVLTAIGWSQLASALRRARGVRTAAAASVVLAAAVATPGATAWASWISSATYRLPAIQAELVERVGDGHAIEGRVAPTLAMRVPVPTIVAQFGINMGDLYFSHAVRWVLLPPGQRPIWAPLHAEAWEARDEVACYDWPDRVCLFRLP